jgi:hypothetical protein
MVNSMERERLMGCYDRRDVAISMHLVANETSTKASQSAEQEATTLLGVGGVHSTLSPISITNTYLPLVIELSLAALCSISTRSRGIAECLTLLSLW